MSSRHPPLAASPLRLVLAGLLALAACDDGPAARMPVADQDIVRPVVVARVAYQPRQQERSFVGTIRPRIESDLGFRVAGRMAERLVDVGDRVRPAQPLARLDPTDLELQLRQAEAELAAAEASLVQAEAAERRGRSLKQDGWSTAATQERLAAAAAEARGRLDRARRARDLAANALAYATLDADAGGVVTAVLAEPGQVVAPGQPVLRLATDGAPEVAVAIPETLVERVRQGRARMTLWAEPERERPVALRELAPAADAAARTFAARFTIPEADPAIALGMTATLTITAADEGRVARLPLSAVHDRGTGPGLWVVDPDNGALDLMPVTLAGFDGGMALIGAGVPDGALVVALGVHKLEQSMRVRIIDEQS